MTTSPNLQQWNLQSLTVIQAMLGVPSPNLRRVTLDHDGEKWLIAFVLESENPDDQEEIEDFETEWDALQNGPEPREVSTLVASGPLPWPQPPKRVLYQRREPCGEQD